MPRPVGGRLTKREFELTLSHRPIVTAEGQHVMALLDENQLGAGDVGRGWNPPTGATMSIMNRTRTRALADHTRTNSGSEVLELIAR